MTIVYEVEGMGVQNTLERRSSLNVGSFQGDGVETTLRVVTTESSHDVAYEVRVFREVNENDETPTTPFDMTKTYKVTIEEEVS